MTATPLTMRALLRRDFLSFLCKCFATLHPGKQLDVLWLHEAMAYKLDQCRNGLKPRLIVTMPPRSLKSITFSVAWPAYLLGTDPSAKIMCVSYGDDLAKRHSMDSRTIMQSPWYRQLFPGTVLIKHTETDLETSRGGMRMATSIGGSITGFGADWIIIDDPLKADEAYSKSARDRANSFFATTLSSRFNDKLSGKTVLVMQRLHEQDLAGYLLELGGWDELRLAAIAQEDSVIPLSPYLEHQRRRDELLQPAREPLAILMAEKAKIGSALFEAQYQQSPTPDEGNAIKREWLKFYAAIPDRTNARFIQSLDTAQKTEPSNDFSVLTTWMMIGDDHYLIDLVRGRWDYPTLKARIIAEWDRHRPDRMLIEDVGSGTGLIQDLRYVRGDITTVPIKVKDEKAVRVATASALIENGRVAFPREAPWLEDCLKELLGFPNARSDDIIDSITQYLNWVRTSGSSSFFHCDWGTNDNVTVETALNLYGARLGPPFGTI